MSRLLFSFRVDADGDADATGDAVLKLDRWMHERGRGSLRPHSLPRGHPQVGKRWLVCCTEHEAIWARITIDGIKECSPVDLVEARRIRAAVMASYRRVRMRGLPLGPRDVWSTIY